MTAQDKSSKRNRWNQFDQFIQEGPTDSNSLSRELRSMGVDIERVNLAVTAITAKARTLSQVGWLERARKSQAEFDRSLHRKSKWVSEQFASSREIAAAISTGRLGPGVQQQAGVFFRNGDVTRANDADLRSFLNDCELLGLIDEGRDD